MKIKRKQFVKDQQTIIKQEKALKRIYEAINAPGEEDEHGNAESLQERHDRLVTNIKNALGSAGYNVYKMPFTLPAFTLPAFPDTAGIDVPDFVKC